MEEGEKIALLRNREEAVANWGKARVGQRGKEFPRHAFLSWVQEAIRRWGLIVRSKMGERRAVAQEEEERVTFQKLGSSDTV